MDREEIELAKIDSDLENMGNNILEDYQETYETAVKFRQDGYDAAFGEASMHSCQLAAWLPSP